MPETGPSPVGVAQNEQPGQRELSAVEAGNLLARTFHEVTQKHLGWSRNTYGELFNFSLHGTDGDVTIGVGTKDPILFWPPQPFMAVPRGLYLVPSDGKVIYAASRAKSLAKFLDNLEAQGVNPSKVTEQVITHLQEKGYKFSPNLTADLVKKGLIADSQAGEGLSPAEALLDAVQNVREVARVNSNAERGEDDRAQMLYGPYRRRDFVKEYPHKRYLRMVEDAFTSNNADRVAERRRLWEGHRLFWNAMTEAESNGMLAQQDLSGFVIDTMITTIKEVDQQRPEGEKELGPFMGLTEHMRQTGDAIGVMAEALREHDPEGKFLSSRNLDLLQMLASFHDVFNGLATLKGQVMLDHQFLLEEFAEKFLREGQTIRIGDHPPMTLSKDDAKFLHALARHENIFEEKDWVHLAEKEGQSIDAQISHAKALMLAADILGPALSVEDTLVEFGEPNGDVRRWQEKRLVLDTDQLPQRLEDVMGRHMAHVDDKGIPVKDADGKTDGKIFRPEWLLTAQTLVLTFKTLWYKYNIPFVRRDKIGNPATALTGAGLSAIRKALRDNDASRFPKLYTEQQIDRIYKVDSTLNYVYNFGSDVQLDHMRRTDQTLTITPLES